MSNVYEQLASLNDMAFRDGWKNGRDDMRAFDLLNEPSACVSLNFQVAESVAKLEATVIEALGLSLQPTALSSFNSGYQHGAASYYVKEIDGKE